MMTTMNKVGNDGNVIDDGALGGDGDDDKGHHYLHSNCVGKCCNNVMLTIE